MCGINGCIGDEKEKVARMNATISYRGPDDTGVYSNGRATIGNNRLAIIDLSPLGHQPMTTTDGRFSIAYNGEIYNFQEIRDELEGLGITFKSHSDTEVILEGYALWGRKITEKLRGMWAFAILDSKEDILFLSRDTFGIKPLYLYNDGDTIAFSSEIRGLLAHYNVKKIVDTDAIRQIILTGHAIAPRTILKYATSVLPGEEIIIDLKTRKISTFIQKTEITSTSAPTDDALEEVLKDSLRKHLIADVPVGLFFSGGTDSSLLAALLQSLGVKLKAYHVSIGKRDDTAYADKIASTLGLDLTTTVLDKETVKNNFDLILQNLDEPIADTSFIPTYLVSKEAKKDVKVVLSGEGGDELFGGYIFHEALSKLSSTPHRSTLKLGRLLTRFPHLAKIYPRLQGLVRMMSSVRNDARGRYMGERVFGSPLNDSTDIETAIDNRIGTEKQPDGVLAYDRLVYLPDNNLLKIDTATMAHSIEGRVPLLDKEVWKLVGGAPLSWKRKNNVGKLPLKRVLAKYVPKELVERSKTGFSVPIDWYFEAIGEERLSAALSWYKNNFSGLIPAFDATIAWGFAKHKNLLLKDMGYSIYAVAVLHDWIVRNKLTI